MSWIPHPSLKGSPTVIRLSASQLDRIDRQCREFAALKARPKVWPREFEERRQSPWESFPLGLVMAALDLVEFDAVDPDDAVDKVLFEPRSPLHPGVASWIRQAVHAYVESSSWLADEIGDVVLAPQRESRVVQHGSPAELRMLTGWGRWYASADGSVREVRRVRMGRFGAAGDASNLALAFISAFGLRAAGAVYRDLPVQVYPDEARVERVRVVEVVLAEERVPKVVIDQDPATIKDSYLQHGQRAAQDVVFGGARVPGSDCAQCKLRHGCDELPHLPGLLGLTGPGTHRRTWSVTTGRQYRICPAQAHLRDQHLPGTWGDHPAVRRGVLVHEWLRHAHGRRQPCDIVDLPEPASVDYGLAGGFMTAEDYRQIRPFLISHLEVCPLRSDEVITDIRPEPKIAAYDPDADVLVVANPDLLYRVNGRIVYREQKTTGDPAGIDAADLLRDVPQLALAICLVADGAFGDAGTVELEVMTPISAYVLPLDADDPELVARARAEVTALVSDWHTDVEFRPRPSSRCVTCPVARWCPDRQTADHFGPIEVDGVLIDPDTGEILGGAPASGLAHAVAAAITEPETDDEPPF